MGINHGPGMIRKMKARVVKSGHEKERLQTRIKELEAKVAELQAALVCPCSTYGTHRCVRCDSEVEP